MIITDWRALLYPLGFLASLGFGARFLLQWLQSERNKKSTVTPLFWQISLVAHLIMACHSLIQIQYPIALIQSLNAVISLRNLDLMGRKKWTFKHCLFLFALTIIFVTLTFVIQSLFITHSFDWMESPHISWKPSSETPSLSFFWNALGLIGMFLFASRFWIQWWLAEKHQKSELGVAFWWISFGGALLSSIYFIKLVDIVNIINYATGLVPYLRNLMLLTHLTQKNERI